MSLTPTPVAWPDFTADNAAFAQAKAELGPTANTSAIAQRAQSIRQRMAAQAEDDTERSRR